MRVDKLLKSLTSILGHLFPVFPEVGSSPQNKGSMLLRMLLSLVTREEEA